MRPVLGNPGSGDGCRLCCGRGGAAPARERASVWDSRGSEVRGWLALACPRRWRVSIRRPESRPFRATHAAEFVVVLDRVRAGGGIWSRGPGRRRGISPRTASCRQAQQAQLEKKCFVISFFFVCACRTCRRHSSKKWFSIHFSMHRPFFWSRDYRSARIASGCSLVAKAWHQCLWRWRRMRRDVVSDLWGTPSRNVIP